LSCRPMPSCRCRSGTCVSCTCQCHVWRRALSGGTACSAERTSLTRLGAGPTAWKIEMKYRRIFLSGQCDGTAISQSTRRHRTCRQEGALVRRCACNISRCCSA